MRCERLGLADDVLITGYLDDAAVPGVLAGARAFCWPALFEGFGIPVVEAQAAGVPVACSDDPSLDEAAGDAALRFAGPRPPRRWRPPSRRPGGGRGAARRPAGARPRPRRDARPGTRPRRRLLTALEDAA